jgi:hypothetical protein
MRRILLAVAFASCAAFAFAQDFDGAIAGGAVSACLANQSGGEAGLTVEDVQARIAQCNTANAKGKGDKVILQRPGDGAANIRACISFVKNQFKRPRPAPPAPAKYSEAEARGICLPG